MVYLKDEKEYPFDDNRYCSELETRAQLTSDWKWQEQRDGFSAASSTKTFPKGLN